MLFQQFIAFKSVIVSLSKGVNQIRECTEIFCVSYKINIFRLLRHRKYKTVAGYVFDGE